MSTGHSFTHPPPLSDEPGFGCDFEGCEGFFEDKCQTCLKDFCAIHKDNGHGCINATDQETLEEIPSQSLVDESDADNVLSDFSKISPELKAYLGRLVIGYVLYDVFKIQSTLH